MSKTPEKHESGAGGAIASLLAIGGLAVGIYAQAHHPAKEPVPHAHVTQKPTVVSTHTAKPETHKPIVTHETSTGQIVPEQIGSFIYFSQTDKRWAWAPYNTAGRSDFNIGYNGCAPTAQAMIISNLTGRSVSPVEAARFNIRHNYVIPDVLDGHEGGGTYGDRAMLGMAPAYGLHATSIDLTFSAVKHILDQHGYVEVNGDDNAPLTPGLPHGHVLAIRDYTQDHQLLIADPSSIANTMSAFPAQMILGPASYAIGVTR